MERSEWDDPVDGDVAPVYPAAPIPLHERTWRHPSELGATSAFVPLEVYEVGQGAAGEDPFGAEDGVEVDPVDQAADASVS